MENKKQDEQNKQNILAAFEVVKETYRRLELLRRAIAVHCCEKDDNNEQYVIINDQKRYIRDHSDDVEKSDQWFHDRLVLVFKKGKLKKIETEKNDKKNDKENYKIIESDASIIYVLGIQLYNHAENKKMENLEICIAKVKSEEYEKFIETNSIQISEGDNFKKLLSNSEVYKDENKRKIIKIEGKNVVFDRVPLMGIDYTNVKEKIFDAMDTL